MRAIQLVRRDRAQVSLARVVARLPSALRATASPFWARICTATDAEDYPERMDVEMARLAERQYGVFSHGQAISAGASRGALARRLAAGTLVRVHPQVYRVAGAPPTWRGSVIAACLAFGPHACASHGSAAALWAFPSFEPGRVEITVPRARGRAIPGVTVHRARDLCAVDVTSRDGSPVTTAARTLLDIAGCAPPDIVEEALDDALRRRLVTVPLLRRRLMEFRRRGRAGVVLFDGLLAAREATGIPESVLETKFLRLLRKVTPKEPKIQYRIRQTGRVVAVADFAYPDARLAIEADGYRWHSGKQRWARDLSRRNTLTQMGWRVIHLTWDDVTRRPEATREIVRAAITEQVHTSRRPRE